MFLQSIYNVDTTSLAYVIVLFDWYRLPIALAEPIIGTKIGRAKNEKGGGNNVFDPTESRANSKNPKIT